MSPRNSFARVASGARSAVSGCPSSNKVRETPAAVDQRLDELSAQIPFLVEEAEENRALKESVKELTSDLTPIAAQTMDSMVKSLMEAEGRGYIDFAKSGFGVVNRVVTNFTEEDVEALGDNVVLILETIKEMTQPELMQMMRSTLHEVSEIEETGPPPGMLELMRQMREPEVRRGLARMIALLRSMGSIEQADVTTDGKEAGE